MPIKGGKQTINERAFAQHYAMTGDRTYAATKAGYAEPSGAASRALQRPAVQAEIAKIQQERLFSEALPAAVQCLISIVQDAKAAAGARVQASKVILDRTLGLDEALKGKEPHEMTPEELAKAIDALERVAAERARQVTSSSAIDDAPAAPEKGVFD